jgi:hypothetical protein
MGVSALLAFSACLSGCGEPHEGRERRAQTAAPSQETFRDFGDYEVHFNAVRTDQLAADIARAADIERSSSRVLLNVTMLEPLDDGGPKRPVRGKVAVDAYNLNGQIKNLEMREEIEGDAIYYIGEVSISGAEILVFDIRAQPEGAPAPYEVQFKREFYTD